jgi:hypothetical protein
MLFIGFVALEPIKTDSMAKDTPNSEDTWFELGWCRGLQFLAHDLVIIYTRIVYEVQNNSVRSIAKDWAGSEWRVRGTDGEDHRKFINGETSKCYSTFSRIQIKIKNTWLVMLNFFFQFLGVG